MKTEEQRIKNKNGYIILPKTFSYKGWNFQQLDRKKGIAIYSKEKEGFVSFEVIKVQNREAYTICDNFVEAKESFPSDEQWGVLGWTFTDEIRARKKFLEIKN